jgi:uncharacterized protein (TIGR03118 family)
MSHHKHETFKKIQLTSDLPNIATYQDPTLINAWGIAEICKNIWIANYGLVSNYDTKGNLIAHVTLPNILGNVAQGTGLVHNKTNGFVITNGPNTATASLLIASTNGAIFAYNKLVDPDNAIVVIDNSTNGAIYTGITILNNHLCVADYFNNRIDVFDMNFVQIYTLPFQDLEVLDPLPSDVAPYNIVTFNNYAYVIYARQPDASGNIPLSYQVTYVNIFNKDGLFVERFINDHHINSWAFIRLSESFGKLKYKFLLGNSDGTINIYNKHGCKVGYVRDECQCKMIVYELKGMLKLDDNVYYASAPISGYDDNPLDAIHGLFGKLDYIQCRY